MTAEVFRDRWGIPHLRASSLSELAHLQGRTTARDRAWQLEWNRHRAEGRTAELVGRPGLVADRFARKARIDEIAHRCYDNLEPETRQWCSDYVDGVNAGLAEGAAGAHEFTALRARPGQWQPWSPLSVFWVQQLLFGGFGYKLWRRHVAARIGSAAFDRLDPGNVETPGSNAWAVSGARTISGRPMIAGDPHRSADFPGVYQQIRLACPEFDVLGFSFPGVPGIQHFGHTGTAAWAITNASADYQDLYLEELDRDGSTVTARGPHGPEHVDHRSESIMVRDGEPEPVEIMITERGPVIIDEPDGPTISLRTPTAVEDDLGFGALLPLLRSRTVDDLQSALQQWVEPVNSAIIADNSGAIRHLVPGRVPRRDPANLEVPVPAWDRRYAWDHGYAPMPVEEVTDLVANGNDRASGGGLGKFYAPDWRADRVRTLLSALPKGSADAEAMAAIHRDVRLGPAVLAQQLLTDLDPSESALTAAARSIRDQILNWDMQMTADSQGALIFAAWRSAMINWLLQQPAFTPLLDPDRLPEVYAATVNPRVRIAYGFDAICQHAAAFDLDLRAGVMAALESVAADPPSGVWGDAHRLLPLHALSTLVGPGALSADLLPPMPQPALAGDQNTVRSTHSTPGITDRCSMASMARYVWDLADRSASRWVVPFGASGRPDSAHYVDQNDAWVAGELHPVITDWTQLTPESPTPQQR